MNLHAMAARCVAVTIVLGGMASQALADSILVAQPKGAVISVIERGSSACGNVSWQDIRQPGTITLSGETIEIKEAKLPLSKEQWEALLSKVAGEQSEITLVNGWDKGPAGLAASLRIAYDIRSQGGTAWVLNGRLGTNKVLNTCTGNYHLTGSPQTVYLTEDQLWKELDNGRFMDARGKDAQTPPNYTWVVGTPANGKAVDIAMFVKDDKVDPSAYSCAVFRGFSVVGCDSLHKSFLAVEAARFANCDTQPKLMPYWGLAGSSRSAKVTQKLWGSEFALNGGRSGDWPKTN